jgi:hypothetical protein
MSDAASDAAGRRDRGSLAVALALTLLGLGSVVAVVFVGATTTVTRADFAAYQAGCDDLSNQSRLTDAGLGLERVPLDEADVQRCKNTTYAEYVAARRRATYRAPFSPTQWVLYLGFGGLLTGLGTVVLRQELARLRDD